jgi:hypothetical protein
MDPFKSLEVTIDTPLKVVYRKYRKLAFQYHPTRNQEPSAAEKFKFLTKALEDIKLIHNTQGLKEMYQEHGWESLKELLNFTKKKQPKCTIYSIDLKVNLRQIYNKDEITVNELIPIYDCDKKKVDEKRFVEKLILSSDLINNPFIFPCQGIEIPGHIDGDIHVNLVIDWDNEPVYFSIDDNNITYHHKIKCWECFGYFSINFIHPNGYTYVVNDKFKPDETGLHQYILVGHGLNKEGNLRIAITIDYQSFKDINTSRDLIAKINDEKTPVPEKDKVIDVSLNYVEPKLPDLESQQCPIQ